MDHIVRVCRMGEMFRGWIWFVCAAVCSVGPACTLDFDRHQLPGEWDIVDDFNRPDSTELSNGWLEVKGDTSIHENAMESPSISGDYMVVLSGLTGSNQVVEVDLQLLDMVLGRVGIVLRYQDPMNYYLAVRNTGSVSRIQISRIQNGIETPLDSKPIVNPLGAFHLRAQASGSTFVFQVEDKEPLTVTDTTFPSGNVGLLVSINANVGCRADNFAASLND